MGFCNEVMVDLVASYLHSGMGLSEKVQTVHGIKDQAIISDLDY